MYLQYLEDGVLVLYPPHRHLLRQGGDPLRCAEELQGDQGLRQSPGHGAGSGSVCVQTIYWQSYSSKSSLFIQVRMRARGGIDFLSLWRGVIIIFGLQFQNSTWGEEEYFIKLLCIPWPFPINCLGTRIIVLIDWLIDWLTCVGIPWPYPNQLPGVHGSKWWRSC